MAHKNTQEGGHDLTASAFIVLLENKPKGASVTRPQLVLHEHAELGKLLQFGGHLEDSETPWQAALRKAKQEGGFEADELEVWQPWGSLTRLHGATLHPLPIAPNTHLIPAEKTHFHTDNPYLFSTHTTPRKVGAAASGALVLCTAKELAELPTSRIPENVREIGLHVLRSIIVSPEWHPIPATHFTA